jgi:hypothetical protein
MSMFIMVEKQSFQRTVYFPSNGELICVAIKDPQKQIERRLHLLDAVMNIGFRKRTKYTVNVYVAIAPPDTDKKQVESIAFLRRVQLRELNSGDDEVQTEASGDSSEANIKTGGGT